MAILNIRKATRAGARMVLGFEGPSGCGKTYSALQLAYGLAGGDASKVGLLDTENRRGSLYSNIIKDRTGAVQPFLIGDLDAPFSPQRYIDAILEFQEAGVEVLVIDSVSHEWAGLGGCIDIAASKATSLAGWKAAKPEHKRFMNVLLQSNMHIICCIRMTNKIDWSDPKKPVHQGLQPIQQEEFVFELTASITLENGGRSRFVKKCPEDLIPIFGEVGEVTEGHLKPKHGLHLRRWVEGGEVVDQTSERARNKLRAVAEQGPAAVTTAFSALTDDERSKIGDAIPDDIMAAAEAFEEARRKSNDGQGADDLNGEFGDNQ